MVVREGSGELWPAMDGLTAMVHWIFLDNPRIYAYLIFVSLGHGLMRHVTTDSRTRYQISC
jgi:hypothetical protein